MSKKDKKKPEEVKEEIVREPEQKAVEEISPEEKLQKVQQLIRSKSVHTS